MIVFMNCWLRPALPACLHARQQTIVVTVEMGYGRMCPRFLFFTLAFSAMAIIKPLQLLCQRDHLVTIIFAQPALVLMELLGSAVDMETAQVELMVMERASVR